MLPMYIIEKLEKEKRTAFEEVFIERPDFDDQIRHRREYSNNGQPEERPHGIEIIDYLI